MDAEHTSIDDSPQAEVVKNIAAVPPNVDRSVLALTLVIKAVDLGDLPRLMVTPNEGNAIWVADFQGKKKEERFDGIEASIDKIALIE